MPSLPVALVEFLTHVGKKLDESKTVSVAYIAAPVVGSACIALGQTLDDKPLMGWIWVGVVLLALTVAVGSFLEWYRGVAREAAKRAEGSLLVTLKDALQPIAEMLADMQGMKKADRRAQVERVADQCSQALMLVLQGVQEPRVVVYQVEDRSAAQRTMSALVYTRGRNGQRPQPFIVGTPRGDAAFKTVDTDRPCHVHDVRDAAEIARTVGAYAGSRQGYRSFVSAAITDECARYGMVTVDSPAVKAFTVTEKYLIMLVADLMAVAFAAVRESR